MTLTVLLVSLGLSDSDNNTNIFRMNNDMKWILLQNLLCYQSYHQLSIW